MLKVEYSREDTLISILNKREKLIIVCHEIYGINQHIKDVCHKLSKVGFDVICPNLLNREQPFPYADEQKAYHHFTENVGFTYSANNIKDIVLKYRKHYRKIFIVGFSVGATIAWLCSNEDHIDGIVGYYGSRIRDYLDVVPSYPTLLFFPEEERSFHVNELLENLTHSNIELYKMKGHHGFSDPFSPNYHANSATKAFNKMIEFIQR